MSDPIRDSLEEFQDEFLTDDLPEGPQYRTVDYSQELSEAQNKAKKTMRSLIEFYFDKELITKDEYLKYKQKINEQTLQQLMFLMKTGQEALIKLMQTVDAGSFEPRMFEVLATLQKSQLDIVKDFSLTVTNAEEDFRRAQMEVESKNKRLGTGETNTQVEGGGNKKMISSSTKDLIKDMEEFRQEEPYEGEETLEEVQERVKQSAAERKPEELSKRNDDDIEDADFSEIDEF